MQKMKPKFKKMWLDALRSGRFKQGRGMLDSGRLDYPPTHSYCPLGVLCRVAGVRFTVRGVPRRLRVNGKLVSLASRSILYDEGRAFFGLSEMAMNRLIKLNDDREKSFAEIADWIEGSL